MNGKDDWEKESDKVGYEVSNRDRKGKDKIEVGRGNKREMGLKKCTKEKWKRKLKKKREFWRKVNKNEEIKRE